MSLANTHTTVLQNIHFFAGHGAVTSEAEVLSLRMAA